MNDLISRQAAIDAIHNLYAIHGSEGSWIDQKDAFKALNSLPSAQPTVDAEPVIRCKDCKHRPKRTGNEGNGFDYEFPDYKCPCQCDDGWYNRMPSDNWFCANGERKEE